MRDRNENNFIFFALFTFTRNVKESAFKRFEIAAFNFNKSFVARRRETPSFTSRVVIAVLDHFINTRIMSGFRTIPKIIVNTGTINMWCE